VAILVDVDTLRTTLDVPVSVVPDADLEAVCLAVDAAVLPLLTNGMAHVPGPNCQEAGLGIAVQVWQSRTAPGGAMVGVDLNPLEAPHLLGPGLIPRFMGLLSPCTPYGGAVVA
jgi:hypothetical protein